MLEGLNACFDHRAEIYIPELGLSFQVQHDKTKIFGCQNPFTQGGGRKGLPKSFLNRFTQVCGGAGDTCGPLIFSKRCLVSCSLLFSLLLPQVFVDPLTSKDMEFIGDSIFPRIDKEIIGKMVEFSNRVCGFTVFLFIIAPVSSVSGTV